MMHVEVWAFLADRKSRNILIMSRERKFCRRFVRRHLKAYPYIR